MSARGAGPMRASRLLACLGLLLPLPASGQERPEEREEPEEPPQVETRMVMGQVHAPDERRPGGLRVYLLQPGRVDSAAVQPDGRFTIVAPWRREGGRVLIDAANHAARWYFPSLIALSGDGPWQPLSVVLVPRVWRIAAGKYAGRVAEVNLRAAFEPPADDDPGSFYAWQIAAQPGRRDRPQSWGRESFPLAVAFDHETTREPIAGRDSVAFWRTVEEMEQRFGQDLFRPGALAEVTGPGGRGIRLWVDSTMGRWAEGWGGVRIDAEGRIVQGTVELRQRPAGRTAVVVQHELMHALGFGHTCSWPSLMTVPSCYRYRTEEASVFDVAHVQVSLAVRAAQAEHDADHGLAAAWLGQQERAVEFTRR